MCTESRTSTRTRTSTIEERRGEANGGLYSFPVGEKRTQPSPLMVTAGPPPDRYRARSRYRSLAVPGLKRVAEGRRRVNEGRFASGFVHPNKKKPSTRTRTIEERMGEANGGLYSFPVGEKGAQPAANGRCCLSPPKNRSRSRSLAVTEFKASCDRRRHVNEGSLASGFVQPHQKNPRTRTRTIKEIERGESIPANKGVVRIEAIDQAGQHGYDPREHFLTWADPVGRNEALSYRRIEAGGALECRATGVIEKLRAMASVTFTVSLGRIEKHREACSVKLVN
jgi:hypothetical protein